MRKIGIALTTWNRYQQTIDSFKQVLDDDRIAEVAITDDASTDGSFEKLKEYFKDNKKVKLYQNEKNLDCYACKHKAVENSSMEYLILLDSDNTITTEYLDAIYDVPVWDYFAIYQPTFAKPHFDFRKWTGLTIMKQNVAKYADTHLMTSLNAMNFFINRAQYLMAWDGSVDAGTSDSIYFSYCWLISGRKIFLTPNLEYEHFIADDNSGHYQTNYLKSREFHEELMNKIRQLH